MHIPAAWAKVLRLIRTSAPSAILAGGALRDLDNHRPIKDLDIFVHGDSEIEALSAAVTLHQTFDAQYVEGTKDVSHAFKVLSAFEDEVPEVNIVQLRDPFTALRCIERMDFGICQIAFLGNGLVLTTPAYDHDRSHHSITLTRADSQAGYDWSIRRYHRLAKKYQWPLVIPDEFAAFRQAA